MWWSLLVIYRPWLAWLTQFVIYSCQLLLVDLAGHLASVRLRYGLGRESTVWLVLKALSVGLAMKALWFGLGSTVCLA